MSDRLQKMSRYELKYWISESIMRRVCSFLENFMKFDPQMANGEPYKVTSLYLDTRDYTAYYEKYNGDSWRNKYRIRFYNDDPSRLFFEIKAKRGSFVTKIRRECANGDSIDQVIHNLKRGRYDETAPEFAFFTHRLDLQPCVWTSYHRTAYVGRNNPKLRVTFDRSLSGDAADGRDNSKFEFEPMAFSQWSPRQIMEIKFDRLFPFWLDTLMRELNVPQESISKFGIVMKRCLFLVKEPAWTH